MKSRGGLSLSWGMRAHLVTLPKWRSRCRKKPDSWPTSTPMAEVFLAEMKDLRLADGRDRVIRHGHGPERTIQTGIGAVEVARVKIRDRGAIGDGERIRFTSAILRLWRRRTKS